MREQRKLRRQGSFYGSKNKAIKIPESERKNVYHSNNGPNKRKRGCGSPHDDDNDSGGVQTNEIIRQSRQRVGCDCHKRGIKMCAADLGCSCMRNGVGCVTELSTCGCTERKCHNPYGRDEFDSDDVQRHRNTVLKMLHSDP